MGLRTPAAPGFDDSDGKTGQQQDNSEGMDRLVEGERVVNGGRGAEVAGC